MTLANLEDFVAYYCSNMLKSLMRCMRLTGLKTITKPLLNDIDSIQFVLLIFQMNWLRNIQNRTNTINLACRNHIKSWSEKLQFKSEPSFHAISDIDHQRLELLMGLKYAVDHLIGHSCLNRGQERRRSGLYSHQVNLDSKETTALVILVF